MVNLLSTAQMRAIEAAVMASGEVTGLELMERAGRGVFRALMAHWPQLGLTPHRAVILCGPGNNGGDGFVVARLLREQGWEVACYLLGEVKNLPPDARTNATRWAKLGATHPMKGSDHSILEGADLVVDAVFGIGISRPVEGDLDQLLRRRLPAKWVAIDVPSGLCADSGKMLREGGVSGRFADLTVTFEAPKWGHYLGDGPHICGSLAVAPIGILTDRHRRPMPDDVSKVIAKYANDIVALDPGAPKTKDESTNQRALHKYDRGHALILSGGSGKTGAARLAARGALRVGAGLVTLGVPPDAQQEVASQITSIMMKEVSGAEALNEVLQDKRMNALCLGPGLGLTDEARALVLAALEAKRGTVLDADALTLFQSDPQSLFDHLHRGCVLTPHTGEFARLFPDLAERLRGPTNFGEAGSKVGVVREAAQRAGCTVLLKGADTVVADSEQPASITAAVYERAAPMLATAGSGDVLAGFVSGLMAQGLPGWRAAPRAAWLHQECGRVFGPGLIAEDLPEVLPRVLAAE